MIQACFSFGLLAVHLSCRGDSERRVACAVQAAAAVELRGANFDWNNWAGLPAEQLAAQKAAAAALLRHDEGGKPRKSSKPGPFLKCPGGLCGGGRGSRGAAAQGIKAGKGAGELSSKGETESPATHGDTAISDAALGVSDAKLGLGEAPEALPTGPALIPSR